MLSTSDLSHLAKDFGNGKVLQVITDGPLTIYTLESGSASLFQAAYADGRIIGTRRVVLGNVDVSYWTSAPGIISSFSAESAAKIKLFGTGMDFHHPAPDSIEAMLGSTVRRMELVYDLERAEGKLAPVIFAAVGQRTIKNSAYYKKAAGGHEGLFGTGQPYILEIRAQDTGELLEKLMVSIDRAWVEVVRESPGMNAILRLPCQLPLGRIEEAYASVRSDSSMAWLNRTGHPQPEWIVSSKPIGL